MLQSSNLIPPLSCFHRAVAKLSGQVWLDRDFNGTQDADEQYVPGVNVTLFNAAGDPLGTAATDASGKYLFTDLYPGDYYVVVDLPAANASGPFYFTQQVHGGSGSAAFLYACMLDPVVSCVCACVLAARAHICCLACP